MKRHVNSQSTRGAHATLTPVGSQELDKQNVDTNALLKLANTHVRAEPFVRVSAARLSDFGTSRDQLAELRRAFADETMLVEASLEQARELITGAA